MQEADPDVADDRGRGSLFPLADGREVEWVLVGVLPSLVAARTADQPTH